MDEVQPTRLHPSRAAYMDLQEVSASESDSRDRTRPSNPQVQSPSQGADYAPLHPSTRSWEVARNYVTIEKVIGKGAFGQVAKGTAMDLRGRLGKTAVAVKMLKSKPYSYFFGRLCVLSITNNKWRFIMNLYINCVASLLCPFGYF